MRLILLLTLLLTACGKPMPVSNEGTGTACTVTQTICGAMIQCPDGSTANIYHGKGYLHGQDKKDCEE